MATIIYTRPSGSEIEVDACDENKALAKELGWTKKKKPKSEPTPQLDLGDANA